MNYENMNIHLPRWNELPNINLYLDQVVTLVNNTLSSIYIEDCNLILTKNMINNYVKNKIIEPPIKKKYTKNHLAKFFVICILKEVYKINDIKILIDLALSKSSIDLTYNNFSIILIFNCNFFCIFMC